MEKRIELEKRGQPNNKVKELILDNCRSTSIQGLNDEYVNLEALSLIDVGLTSLKGFPKLPKLKKLEISDNRISSGLNALQTSPCLSSLNISNNRIKDLEVLEPLNVLKHLRTLDLFNNEVTKMDNYREAVFNMLPSLLLLDGFDRDNAEAEEDEDEENGNEEEEEESDDEDDDSDDVDDDEEDGVGLAAVYKDNLEEESEGDEYEGEEEEDESLDEEDDDGEEEGEPTPRGKKRKLEDGGKEDSGSKKSNGPSV